MTQDPDTLDTWFSSALWPFSTLGWPNENAEDYNYFYPTNTLVTGYDIIGFWVSRMIFSGLAYTGKAPFDTVLIHGIVRDSQGRKMSKSLGNGIDPLEVIEQYGADALRMMLIIGSTAGNDMRYSDEKVLACRNFANKLWNASRFVQMNLPEDFAPGLPEESLLDMSDKWILSELAKVAAELPPTSTSTSWAWPPRRSRTSSGSLLRLVYRDLQDPPERRGCGSRRRGPQGAGLRAGQGAQAAAPLHAVHHRGDLSALPGSAETIMNEKWPGDENMKVWAEDCADFEKLMDYIKAVRAMRAEMNVTRPKRRAWSLRLPPRRV